jgi:hypothetical protein
MSARVEPDSSTGDARPALVAKPSACTGVSRSARAAVNRPVPSRHPVSGLDYSGREPTVTSCAERVLVGGAANGGPTRDGLGRRRHGERVPLDCVVDRRQQAQLGDGDADTLRIGDRNPHTIALKNADVGPTPEVLRLRGQALDEPERLSEIREPAALIAATSLSSRNDVADLGSRAPRPRRQLAPRAPRVTGSLRRAGRSPVGAPLALPF